MILVFYIFFEWGRISESPVDKYEAKYNARPRPNYFFCERLRTSCCILSMNFRKLTLWNEIVGFLKSVVEFWSIVCKCLPKRICLYLQFAYIRRTYTSINYRNVWFAKVIVTIIRPIQVLIFHLSYEKIVPLCVEQQYVFWYLILTRI